MACSTPPIYVSTGNSADAFSGSNGLVKKIHYCLVEFGIKIELTKTCCVDLCIS